MKHLLSDIQQYLSQNLHDHNLNHANDRDRHYSNKRRWPRYPLEASNISWITLHHGKTFPVEKISYRGLALKCSFNEMKPYLSSNHNLHARLNISDFSYGCELCPASETSTHTTGLYFVSKNEPIIYFLRKILEYIRIGLTMKQIPPSSGERSSSSKIICYAGDSDSSITFHAKAHDQINTCILSFKDLDTQNLVTYHNGSISFEILSTKPTATHITALRQSYFILVGLQEQQTIHPLNPILQALQSELQTLMLP